MRDLLTITDLTRRFGNVVANDKISFSIRPGEVLGLLGHNGAGKTTLVSQLVGLLRPDAGSIVLGDLDVVAHPAAARRHIVLQSQAQAPIDGLTPRAAIEIACRLRGLSVPEAKAAAVAVAEELQITDYLDRRAQPEGGGLSGGIRRLTAFAMAAATPSPLLVLDEPTNDVDASRRRALWDVVRRRADEGAGVLLVTHNVTEAERVVDELVILDRGRVVAKGTPAELRGNDTGNLRLELHMPSAAVDPTLHSSTDLSVPYTRQPQRGRNIVMTLAPDDAGTAVTWAHRLKRSGQITSYALAPTSLEDAYLAYTSAQPDHSLNEQDHAHV